MRHPLRVLSGVLVHAIAALYATSLASALSPDARLTPLIPPDSHIVAGMRAPSFQGPSNNFLIITPNNRIDLNDFFALSGADTSRLIHQVIFVAGTGADRDVLSEHSLLVAGHFDRALIIQSADRSGAQSEQYRGIAVLVVQPLERERGVFTDLRWLAFISSDVAIFGTVNYVKQELDRHLANRSPDPTIVERLTNLRGDDGSWCQLAGPLSGDEIHNIQNALRMLDPKLANLGENGSSFQFGIRFGNHIEFEYDIFGSPNSASHTVPSSVAGSLAGAHSKQSSLLPHSRGTGVGEPRHGVVKISRARYEEWQKEVSRLSRTPVPLSSR